MQPITVEQLLEQVELGAAVLPMFAPAEVVVQVGRHQFACPASFFTDEQAVRFMKLYRAGGIRLEYPGDFEQLPAFPNQGLGVKPNTAIVTADVFCRTRVGAFTMEAA